MKLSIVSDHQGRILSIFPAPPEVPEAGEKGRLAYVPKPDEQVHVLKVPSSFENRPLRDIHTMLRVEMRGDTAQLVEK